MKYKRLTNMVNQIQTDLIGVATQSKSVISSGIKNSYIETYNITGYSVESALQVNLGFSAMTQDRLVASKVLDGVIVNQSGELIDPFKLIRWKDSVNESISGYVKQVKQTLTKGLIKGDSYQTMAKELNKVGGKKAFEIDRILRTEGNRASSRGYLEAYDEIQGSAENLGLNVNNKWLATLDGDTRPSHQRLDNTLAKIADDGSQYFEIDGATAPAPRLFGIAAEDINCRCALTLEVDGLEDGEYRKARDENNKSVLVKNQSYQDWAKTKGIKTKL